MLTGNSGEEKTTWCYRLWRVILLELNMLTSTMRDWTSQINSMRVGTLVCLIVVAWYQDLDGMSWSSIHCPWHDELSVSGIEEKTILTCIIGPSYSLMVLRNTKVRQYTLYIRTLLHRLPHTSQHEYMHSYTHTTTQTKTHTQRHYLSNKDQLHNNSPFHFTGHGQPSR